MQQLGTEWRLSKINFLSSNSTISRSFDHRVTGNVDQCVSILLWFAHEVLSFVHTVLIEQRNVRTVVSQNDRNVVR